MNPYFSESGIILYCAKAEEIVPRLPVGHFSVLVFDPPYSLYPDRMEQYLEQFGQALAKTTEAFVLPFLSFGCSAEFGLPFARPVEQLKELLASTTGAILDPYAGVGSTLVAAKQLQREAVGIEMDPKRCAVIVERLQAA